MTEGAVERYILCVHGFAIDLSRETSRLEEAERAQAIEDPEITTTMVVKANEAVRHPISLQDQPTMRVIIAQTFAFSFAILTPIAGAYLHSWLQWVLTSLFGVVAIAAQVYSILNMRRR